MLKYALDHTRDFLMRQLRFLVIQLRQIGDVLISTTLCETLKRSFPDAQVDYCVYPYTAAMAQHNPSIDNLIIIPNGAKNNAFFKLLKCIFFMRKQKYDYAIEVLDTPKSVMLARLSGAKTIIGRASGKARARYYDITVKYEPEFLQTINASESVKNRLALLTPISEKLQYVTEYKIHLTATEKDTAKKQLLAAGVDITKPIFFFSLSSRSPHQKQWPLAYFIETMNHCITQYGAQIITAPGSASLADDLHAKTQIKQPENYFVFPHLGLREVAAMIAHCRLFVGNDSGPRHMAIAVGTPSVAIFSPQINHYDWDLPNHPKHRAVTLNTVLQLNKTEYLTYHDTVRDSDIPANYLKITPDLVLHQINYLLNAVSS